MTTPTRILIVEDNALNLELATNVLRALRLARAERPDLILLDEARTLPRLVSRLPAPRGRP